MYWQQLDGPREKMYRLLTARLARALHNVSARRSRETWAELIAARLEMENWLFLFYPLDVTVNSKGSRRC